MATHTSRLTPHNSRLTPRMTNAGDTHVFSNLLRLMISTAGACEIEVVLETCAVTVITSAITCHVSWQAKHNGARRPYQQCMIDAASSRGGGGILAEE